MPEKPLQIVIEIERREDRYGANRHLRGIEGAGCLDPLELAPNTLVTIKGQRHPLVAPLDLLLADDGQNSAAAVEFFFDEQGQFELGAYLYQQIFGKLTPDEERALDVADRVDLVVVTSDPFAARLPWVLLVRKQHFLAAGRWSIALGTRRDALERSCELPASPKLLVVSPNRGDGEVP